MSFRRALRAEMTPAEYALWRLLRNSQVKGRKFRRQHQLGPYVADFYCAAEKLVVELDGTPHLNPVRRLYDDARTRALAAYGIRVLRFENHEVFDHPERVVEAIAWYFRD